MPDQPGKGRKRPPRTVHDALFKAVFSDPVLAAEELREVLPPALVEHIVWPTLTPMPANFVDEVFEQRLGDLVFRARLGSDHELLLWCVLEHQRKEDRWMSLRVVDIENKLWQHWRRDHPPAVHVPAVLPVVVYHGDRPWRAPTDMRGLYALPEDLHAAFGEHLLSCRFVLDDLCATSDEALRARRMDAYARLCLFAMARGAAEDFLDRIVGDWHAEMRQLLVAEHRDRAFLFLRYTLHVHPHADPETLRERLVPVFGVDAEEIIMSVAEKLIQQGREQGFDQGRQEGRKEGRKEGERKVLLRLLARRFGTLPAEISARISAARPPELERWADRVLDAESLDDVFGD